MHEMSLAQGIVDMVEQAAVRERFAYVKQLRLEVGALSGVELHALRFALDSMSHEGVLRGTEFVFDIPVATAWCLHCSQTVSISERGQACPQCGSHQIQPISGTQLRVVDMIVLDQ